MRCTFGAVVVVCALGGSALAEAPIRTFVPYKGNPDVQSSPFLISHILYLNNCANSSCKVSPGATDSRRQTSDIIQQPGTLSPYTGDWNALKSCIANIMSPFNITIVDTDPGPNVDHFEVMIGGTPGQVGLSSGIGGIADFPCQSPGSCQPFIQDALVFDFAGVWGNDVTETCGTAAQEIAHAWTLDHTQVSSDPMTYNNYITPLHYSNNAPCGSDCVGGKSPAPFSLTCTGSGLQSHTCMSSGTATQNEIDIITNLFGPAGAAAPTVKITNPTSGEAVQSGMAFPVTITCDTPDGVAEIDFEVDGAPVATLTTSPANFMGPANLMDGSHTISAACGTNKKASAIATSTFIVGKKCAMDSDCPTNDICYMSACIGGPNATGGLGAACTANAMCSSGECASDGTNQLCVIPCNPSMDTCPSGFGCIMSGSSGVCWKGASHGGGGGGCSANGGAGGAFGFGALLAMTWITRRRRPTR
jgi:uncharacterized protein (TIGR03382 family)